MKTRQTRILLAIAMASLFMFNACTQDNKQTKPAIQKDLIAILENQGYSTNNVIVTKEGYIIEGDLLFTEGQIKAMDNIKPSKEQYHPFNTVKTDSSRTITVSIGSNANNLFVAALDLAISRYNALSLRLKFTRVARKADIQIAEGSLPAGIYAQAGFPANGNPFPTVTYQSAVFGSAPSVEFVASVLAHELGHCIGLRHAKNDFAHIDNSAEPRVDAYLAKGTASHTSANSYMLAHIDQNENRPFSISDIAVLQNMYNPVILDGIFVISNKKSGKNLAIPNGALTNGIEAIQWTHIEGAFEQQWQFVSLGYGHHYIINKNSNKYLAIGAGSTASGESAKQWEFTGGFEQQWLVEYNGVDNNYIIYNRNSNKVLCISEGSVANGGRAIQWDNLNSLEQRWGIMKVMQ